MHERCFPHCRSLVVTAARHQRDSSVTALDRRDHPEWLNWVKLTDSQDLCPPSSSLGNIARKSGSVPRCPGSTKFRPLQAPHVLDQLVQPRRGLKAKLGVKECSISRELAHRLRLVTLRQVELDKSGTGTFSQRFCPHGRPRACFKSWRVP
jgi:hypothetical protein